MIRRVLTICMAIMASVMMIVPSISLAKDSTLKNVSYTVANDDKGQDYLHVELETNHEVEEFSANVNPNNPKQLIFRMANTRISNIPREEKLDGNIGRKVFLQEIDGNYVQGKLYTNSELDNNSFKMYALDKSKTKKQGVAIDIYKHAANKGSNSNITYKPTDTVANVKGKTITLDPGHGGSDTGAIGPSGFTEKEATLAITQDLAAILHNSGANVIMTRNTDVDVYGPNASGVDELQARVDVGNNAGADIFVSIHCNAFSSPSANGTETFYYGGSYQGHRLATFIQNEMIAQTGLRNRGVSTANFYVLKHSDMPAVLVETAFITNYNEEALLKDANWQMQEAGAIARGISAYFS